MTAAMLMTPGGLLQQTGHTSPENYQERHKADTRIVNDQLRPESNSNKFAGMPQIPFVMAPAKKEPIRWTEAQQDPMYLTLDIRLSWSPRGRVNLVQRPWAEFPQ